MHVTFSILVGDNGGRFVVVLNAPASHVGQRTCLYLCNSETSGWLRYVIVSEGIAVFVLRLGSVFVQYLYSWAAAVCALFLQLAGYSFKATLISDIL